MYLFELSFSLDICPGVRLLYHMVFLFLVFQESPTLFSILARPISLPSMCMYPHVLYIFPLSRHFTCFTTFCLCENYFLQSQRPGPLSLTTDLVARIWCFYHCNPHSKRGFLFSIPSPAFIVFRMEWEIGIGIYTLPCIK